MTNNSTEWDDMDEGEDEEFGLWEAECRACDIITRVDDTGLCEECAGKLERDFIRRREWAYSALAFGCPEGKLEALRDEIIKSHGERLELLADEKRSSPARQRNKRDSRSR